MKHTTRLFISYVGLALALLMFSYTQVDLNLTLSRVNAIQAIEKSFQYVGYYMRPYATGAYIAVSLGFFVLYWQVIRALQRQEIGASGLWKIIFAVTAIVVFSYPAAFSYDFFNYMFTAKTVLVYHQSPYVVTPLEFAGIDPWTNFMRWTHLTTAYAPLWIVLTFIPYIVGLGYFVLVLFTMKFMVAGFYLLTAWMVYKSIRHVDRTYALLGLAVFALNPLILVESLVSGHNDVVLTAFAMTGIFMYVTKRIWPAWFFWACSVAAKTMTIVLLPVLLLKRNFYWMLCAMLAGLAIVLTRREFLPWYWVWIVPFVALLARDMKVVRASLIISLGLVMSYAPYFYFGDYGGPEQVWKIACIWSGVGFGIFSFVFPSSAPPNPKR